MAPLHDIAPVIYETDGASRGHLLQPREGDEAHPACDLLRLPELLLLDPVQVLCTQGGEPWRHHDQRHAVTPGPLHLPPPPGAKISFVLGTRLQVQDGAS